MKAIPISVFKNGLYGGCSNHGVSESYDELLFVHPHGFLDVNGDEPNLVEIEQHCQIGGQRYARIIPVNVKGRKCMGGSFAGCSDARFIDAVEQATGYRMGVLPLHDRVEA